MSVRTLLVTLLTVISVLAIAPFWTSFLIRTYAWITILKQEGLLNGLLQAFAVTAAPVDLLYTPFAVIVTCSDSRVPPELIFDQALGDIFVVRVAGNVIDPVTLGSVEYAAEHLHAPLVVVMGHTECGAVSAAVEGGEAPGDIAAIVRRIEPAVALAKAGGATGADLAAKSVLLNVELQTKAVEHSKILEELVHEGKLGIVGAEYDIRSGEITWL